MDIKYIIKDYFRSKNLQDFINRRFRDDSFMLVRTRNVKYVSYGDGLHFSPRSYSTHGVQNYYILDQMISENPYHVEDIFPNDIVIDVGANVGDFSLLSATRTKNKIISVEPVMHDVLEENILLNKREKQIIPLKMALGRGEKVFVSWWGEKIFAESVSLSRCIELAGGRCDFMKIDCEGGEWDGILQCDELDKIGRVAMEYHYYTKEHDINLLVAKFKDFGFDVKVEPIDTYKPERKGDATHIGMMYCTREDWKHS